MKKILLVILAAVSYGVQAEYHMVRSEDDLRRELNSHDRSLVCFGDFQKDEAAIDDLQQLADSRDYRGSVGFIFADAENNESLYQVAGGFGYRDKPLCVLFRRDRPGKGRLEWPFSVGELQRFIRRLVREVRGGGSYWGPSWRSGWRNRGWVWGGPSWRGRGWRGRGWGGISVNLGGTGGRGWGRRRGRGGVFVNVGGRGRGRRVGRRR